MNENFEEQIKAWDFYVKSLFAAWEGKEIWMDIKGYEGLYKVSNLGRVLSLARLSARGHKVPNRFIGVMPSSHGYCCVNLNKNKIPRHYHISQLVALNFLPNTNNLPEVNHISGVKTDDSLPNLEWSSGLHNKLHAFHMKLTVIPKGEKSHKSKLTDMDVAEIWQMIKSGISKKIVANKFNISLSNIHHILQGKTWTHITDSLGRIQKNLKYNRKLNKSQVIEIMNLFASGQYTKLELSKIFNICTRQIHGIVTGEYWKNLQHLNPNKT